MDGHAKFIVDLSRNVAPLGTSAAPKVLTGTPGTTTFVPGVTSTHTYNNLSAAATSKLPAGPSSGDRYSVIIEDATSAAQGVTIDGNGKNVQSATSPTTLAATFVDTSVGTLEYEFADGAWRLV